MAAKSRDDIIAAARSVFAQHGFKRTTMADLAEAAGMSRPALYLVFPSKEDAFIAVAEQHFAAALGEVRTALPKLKTPAEQLNFALEVWLVRPFQAVAASPNASDLYESGFQFARAAMLRSRVMIAEVLAEIFEPLVRRERSRLDDRQLAQTLLNAGLGVKQGAADVDALRTQLSQLIAVFLAGLGEESLQRGGRKPPK